MLPFGTAGERRRGLTETQTTGSGQANTTEAISNPPLFARNNSSFPFQLSCPPFRRRCPSLIFFGVKARCFPGGFQPSLAIPVDSGRACPVAGRHSPGVTGWLWQPCAGRPTQDLKSTGDFTGQHRDLKAELAATALYGGPASASHQRCPKFWGAKSCPATHPKGSLPWVRVKPGRGRSSRQGCNSRRLEQTEEPW